MLYLVDKNEKGLNSLKEELAIFPVDVFLHRLDMSNVAQIMDLWAELKNPPDILVNNVEVIVIGPKTKGYLSQKKTVFS